MDQNGYELISAAANKTKSALDAGKYEQATNEWSFTEYVISKVASNIDFYNVLTKIASATKNESKQIQYKELL